MHLQVTVAELYKWYLNKLYLFLRDAKLLLRDSIYKLYINTVYLFLRDAKLLLRDPLIDKLYIYKVYLLLRDAKLLMRDAIYKYSVPPSEGYQTPSEGFHLQVKDCQKKTRPSESSEGCQLPSVLLRNSMLAILRCLLPYALIIEIFLIFKEQRSLKYM